MRFITLSLAVLSALALLAVAAPAALASPLPQDAPGESNLGFLLAGTLLTWAGFFVYAIYIARKDRDLHREVDELRREIANRD